MKNNRDKQAAIPSNLSEYLNEIQMATISKLENFGWKLFFIRRPLFQEVITIMHFPTSGETALIEQDGIVNKAHDVYVRA